MAAACYQSFENLLIYVTYRNLNRIWKQHELEKSILHIVSIFLLCFNISSLIIHKFFNENYESKYVFRICLEIIMFSEITSMVL